MKSKLRSVAKELVKRNSPDLAKEVLALKSVVADASYDRLKKAVFKQLGYDKVDRDLIDTLKDVANHGAEGGFHGFIYFVETKDFFDKNHEEIFDLLHEGSR